MSLRGRNFVNVTDFSNREIEQVLELGLELKTRYQAGIRDEPLRGKTLGMLFQKPSLRTRASFEVAMNQLGGNALYMGPAEVGMGEREAVDDVAMVVSGYFDVICARTFGHDIVEQLAEHASVPVINALSAGEHPCQALADLLTLREWRGDLRGLKVTYVGDGNNVAISLALACAKVGANFAIAAPNGFDLPEECVERFKQEAQFTGSKIEQANTPEEVAPGTHAFYTDVWTSMGQEEERERRLKAFEGFCITEKLCALGEDAIVLHCLPAHYGEEIEHDVTRGPRSAIWDQAHNRLHAQKALLALVTP
ncbi:MAG TPA: ornithine carbamoyltransferase [Planctomycetes bacterium]|nr:ornithine carbamoyltransferase [Planctomycetota bacterium]